MFQEICGTAHAKRAAEVAIAGKHSIVFIGAYESPASELATQTESTLRHVAQKVGFYPKFVISPKAVMPCPCGHWGDSVRECTCSMEMVAQHRLDTWPIQADIWVEVPIPASYQIIAWAKHGFRDGEDDESIINRVTRAYRFDMPKDPEYAESIWPLLEAATWQLFLSPSQVQSVIKLSHTIARLAGSAKIDTVHIAEAIQYRPRAECLISELAPNDPADDNEV